MKPYPLQFVPIFKERIWGGTKLKSELNKAITSNNIGESWEISSVENDVSIVANGSFKGKDLNALVGDYPVEILGTKVYATYGKQFPLLFKYLDAREDLSIQVHPNDELAMKRHHSFGKTEMWYVMQSDQEASLIVGFKEKESPEQFLKNVQNKSLLDILDRKKVHKGDAFLLNTGTIHAIGAGNLIAEIQQTSDLTYRIYDFDRLDTHGNQRELHLDLALDAINYDTVDAQKTYAELQNVANEMVHCQYFTTNFFPLTGSVALHKTAASFTVYMCVEGDFHLIANEIEYKYRKGDTILIPAALTDFQLNGQATLLEIYVS